MNYELNKVNCTNSHLKHTEVGLLANHPEYIALTELTVCLSGLQSRTSLLYADYHTMIAAAQIGFHQGAAQQRRVRTDRHTYNRKAVGSRHILVRTDQLGLHPLTESLDALIVAHHLDCIHWVDLVVAARDIDALTAANDSRYMNIILLPDMKLRQ